MSKLSQCTKKIGKELTDLIQDESGRMDNVTFGILSGIGLAGLAIYNGLYGNKSSYFSGDFLTAKAGAVSLLAFYSAYYFSKKGSKMKPIKYLIGSAILSAYLAVAGVANAEKAKKPVPVVNVEEFYSKFGYQKSDIRDFIEIHSFENYADVNDLKGLIKKLDGGCSKKKDGTIDMCEYREGVDQYVYSACISKKFESDNYLCEMTQDLKEQAKSNTELKRIEGQAGLMILKNIIAGTSVSIDTNGDKVIDSKDDLNKDNQIDDKDRELYEKQKESKK